MQRKSRQHLNKISYVISSEAYKESKNEIFIGLSLKIQSSYKELPMQLFNFIQDLEINGISTSEEVK